MGDSGRRWFRSAGRMCGILLGFTPFEDTVGIDIPTFGVTMVNIQADFSADVLLTILGVDDCVDVVDAGVDVVDEVVVSVDVVLAVHYETNIQVIIKSVNGLLTINL